MLTDRDLRVLSSVCTYYVLNRPQIQHLCFPTDNTGRVTRRRLQALVSEGLINRFSARVIYPNSSPAGSVYYPSTKGCQHLAEQTANDRFLLTPTQCPQSHHILHWLAVSETHIKLDAAIAAQTQIQLDDWINEWDTVNKDEPEPHQRFRLYTLLQVEPRLIAAPDSAFMLTALGYSKVFYVEQDRGTSGVRQVCARKIKGYRELHVRQLHRKHFPQTNVDSFTVVCIANNARRRDALRKAFANEVGAELWKFCSATELSHETFLLELIWFPASGDAMPLVNIRE